MKTSTPPPCAAFSTSFKIATRLDDDGDLVIVQDADSDFPATSSSSSPCSAEISRTLPPPTAGNRGVTSLALANRHNLSRRMPTAVVTANGVRMATFHTDEEVSEDYIKKNCIMLALSSIWDAFVHFEAENC